LENMGKQIGAEIHEKGFKSLSKSEAYSNQIVLNCFR
jgi:hypothetical protein